MQEKMVGVSADRYSKQAYRLMWKAGIRWIRTGCGFPWEDNVGGKLRKSHGYFKEFFRELTNYGFKLMGVTPGPKSMPKWSGNLGSKEYLDTYEEACAFLGEAFKGKIQYWQVANELNIELFRGDLPLDKAVEFLKVGGKGIKQANPEAKLGVNMAGFGEEAIYMYKKLYPNNTVDFDYVGIDEYFGTWGPGGPEKWDEEIDQLYKLTQRPVIIQEFGYASAGEVASEEEQKSGKSNCELKKWSYAWKGGHNPQVQAQYLEECLKVFSTKPYLLGFFWFRWNDQEKCWQCGQPDCPCETTWGLVDLKGNPKPSYQVFKRLCGSDVPPQPSDEVIT